MSNLQDVPLAEPENMSTADQDTTGTKTNSLKRFFKIGKKSNASQEDVSAIEDEANKDATKPGSISRLLTRFKGTTKPDSNDPTSSLNLEDTTARPLPNAKPTLKTSISGYWKLLFHRQKAANRQGLDAEQQPAMEQLMDITVLQQVQQEQQTDPTNTEDVLSETPATSLHEINKSQLKCVPELLQDVQMLTVSEEIIDPSIVDNKEN